MRRFFTHVKNLGKRRKCYLMLSNSSKTHSISVDCTDERRRKFPNDTICIRLNVGTGGDVKITEAQMTAGEALFVSGGLVQLALTEINEKKKLLEGEK